MQDDDTTTPRCLDAVAYPVTFEVGEQLTERGQRRFQARVRMADIVTSDIGTPQLSELDALDQIARAFTRMGSVAACTLSCSG